jgi:hypothetical protein
MIKKLTRMIVVLIVVMLCLPALFGCNAKPDQKRNHGRDPARYPIRCANIFVGITTDPIVCAIYGEGAFAELEGHGGGRYFTDTEKSVTLHTVIGVDKVIDEASIEEGLQIPDEIKSKAENLVSQWLKKSVSVEGGIRLGASLSEVTTRYGPPDEQHTANGKNILKYRADYLDLEYVLEYEARFEFVRDRLVKVTIYNGE